MTLLILQPFHRFAHVTAHSPTLPLLHLHHSSFPNTSVASSTSQLILQPFRCFTYVPGTSSTSPCEPPRFHNGEIYIMLSYMPWIKNSIETAIRCRLHGVPWSAIWRQLLRCMWRTLELHSKISSSYRYFLLYCNRHEHVAERLRRQVVTADASKIRKRSN